MQIFVRCNERGAVALEIQECDTLAEVRKQIGDMEADRDAPTWHDWKVMLGDRELRSDDKSLAYYGVEDGMILQLEVRVHVKLAIRCPPTGRIMTLDGEPEDRILDLKRRLHAKAKQFNWPFIPVPTRQSMLLPHGGEELSDFYTLAEHGINSLQSKQAVLDLAVRGPRPIRLSVKTEDGRAFWLDADEWDSVEELRERLAERNSTHPEDALATAVYCGEELDDDEQFIGSYGIEPLSTIFLNQRRLGERIAARAPPVEMVPKPSVLLRGGRPGMDFSEQSETISTRT